MSVPRRSKRICERISSNDEHDLKLELDIKSEIYDEELPEEQVFEPSNHKKKSPPVNQRISTSSYLDSTKQPLWDTKKVVSATRLPHTIEAPSKYSLRSTRRKTYVESDNRIKLNPGPSSSTNNKRVRRGARASAQAETKKIHYGWLLNGMDNLPVSVFGNNDYYLEDPDESVCVNEGKNWSVNQVMCMGQKALCKWM